jgi:putative oxidoreductase
MGFLSELHRFSDWALLTLRIGVGSVFLFHGLQKRGMWSVQPSEQMPARMVNVLRALSIAEPLGALSVLGGLLIQLGATGFIIVMLSAIRLKTTQMHKGFSDDGGWEIDFVLLTVAIALLILGAGRFSLDRLLLHL